MLAQVSYLGCFISPNKEQFSTLKAIISDFVKGRLNVARDKITLDGKYGGLGMIELDDFITAQQCCWLKRLHNGSPDTYKEIFKILGCDRLDYVDPDSCKIENWPILGGIWQAIRRFYVKFTGTGNNWERLPVLFNPLIKMDRGGKLLCNKFFLHNRPVIGADIAATITGSILWDGERVKSLDDINLLLPVQLSLASYMRLSAVSVFWDKNKLKHVTGVPGLTLSEFLVRTKKGSKKFRNVLGTDAIKTGEKIRAKSTNSFLQAAELIPVPIPVQVPDPVTKALFDSNFLALWNGSFLKNRLRDFLFKFYTNRLGIAARVAHFNAGISECCTFCVKDGRFPAPRETMRHLFVECPLVEKLHNFANSQFWPTIKNAISDPNSRDKCLFWLCGVVPVLGRKNAFIQTATCVINFYVWECKLKKKCVRLGQLQELRGQKFT
jgi:hypothetical protein